MSQTTQIQNHLEQGNTLTAIEALNLFGVFRLSARVKNLRDNGMNIITETVTKDNKSYAKYRMEEK